jgi:putative photosynthetic complex assembly protein 2
VTALAVLYALFLWWFGTGLILVLDRRAQHTFARSMCMATLVLAAALYGLATSSTTPTVTGAFVAFGCALAIWGWQEMSFLMGFITGPRQCACPHGCRGPAHFLHAVQAVIYHEIAIALGAVLVVLLTWGAPNQVGTWTYLLLWAMRVSAKLNLFFGVRNLYEEMLPAHLRYLRSFFERRPMNLLFPWSIMLSTLAAALIWHAALGAAPGSFESISHILVGSLLGIAILEHWFLVLPIPVERLWRWQATRRAKGGAPASRELAAGPVAEPVNALVGPADSR